MTVKISMFINKICSKNLRNAIGIGGRAFRYDYEGGSFMKGGGAGQRVVAESPGTLGQRVVAESLGTLPAHS